MARRDPVGSIYRIFDSGGGDEDGPEFIRCVDIHQFHIHEVWTFGEDGLTREVHPTARVDSGTGFVGEFSTNYVTPSWLRVHTFGRNSINGSVEWLGVTDLLRNDGPPCTINILASYDSWGDRGFSTNPNWVSQSGGGFRQYFRLVE